ncbi:MAG: DUF2807 domain-containing protein, partial [Halioglobus sp.]|nr:DUF2807 domain-containing protein [Halioglobus sp.]
MKIKSLAAALAALMVSQLVPAETITRSDSRGNISQINIGVGRTNRVDDAGQPDERLQATEREVRPGQFSRLTIRVPADVVYTQGSPNLVKLRGPANALRRIRVEEAGGRLTIDTRDNFSSSGRITIEVTGSAVKELELFGAIDARIRRINSARFSIAMSGAVSLQGSGRAGQCVLSVSGSGDADLEGLKCGTLELTAQGAADLHLYADKRIGGSAAGAVDVTVSGN